MGSDPPLLASLTLLVLASLNFPFQHFPNEGCTALPPHQLVNPLAETFGQSDVG
ncbi:hypothetical protein [Sphingobium sp. Leaf26]|uniref:hypothetical protein n=1 Tax=Sphingobium sp. Leaf26 TaxID=1735693 RepID=UPI000B156B46|nr:hypothetical protein [Sphingobium sp. Leaf26]